MSEEQRQSSKLLEPGSFDVYKNAAASIIVILGHSEVDMEVSDIGMETAGSDDCREISRNNRSANSMLTITCKGARFFCKDRQKFINLFTQSISGLC